MPYSQASLTKYGNALSVVSLTYNTSTTSYPPRPSVDILPGGCVEYIGPTQPLDWLDNDTWIDNS